VEDGGNAVRPARTGLAAGRDLDSIRRAWRPASPSRHLSRRGPVRARRRGSPGARCDPGRPDRVRGKPAAPPPSAARRQVTAARPSTRSRPLPRSGPASTPTSSMRRTGGWTRYVEVAAFYALRSPFRGAFPAIWARTSGDCDGAHRDLRPTERIGHPRWWGVRRGTGRASSRTSRPRSGNGSRTEGDRQGPRIASAVGSSGSRRDQP